MLPLRPLADVSLQLAAILQLQHHLELVFQQRRLVDQVALAGQQRGQIGVGIGRQEAVGQRFKFGQPLCGPKVQRVLLQRDVVARRPLRDDVRPPAERLAVSVLARQQRGGILAAQRVLRQRQPEVVGKAVRNIARLAGPAHGQFVHGCIRGGAIDQRFGNRRGRVGGNLVGEHRILRAHGRAVRPLHAAEQLEGDLQAVHLQFALAVPGDCAIHPAAAAGEHRHALRQRHQVAVGVQHLVAGLHGLRQVGRVAAAQAGNFLQDHRLRFEVARVHRAVVHRLQHAPRAARGTAVGEQGLRLLAQAHGQARRGRWRGAGLGQRLGGRRRGRHGRPGRLAGRQQQAQDGQRRQQG